MTNFLFLHGSWHGAWCWHKVLPHMAAAGASATAIDLPGRGRAPVRPAFVGLSRMVDAAVAALPEGPTTVVAHSRNGIVASALAERAPDKITRTIYLAAYMLPPGRRVLDYLPDEGSLLTEHIKINRLGLSDSLDPAAYREGLYADCTETDIALATALLGPEPVRPALTRLKLSLDRYGRVPRAYIRLTEDRAVTPALQDRLIAETGASRVESLKAGHSAYFSQAEALANTILDLSKP